MIFKSKSIRISFIASIVMVVTGLIVSCTTTVTKEKELTPGGQVAYEKEQENQKVVYELRRVFANTKIEGIGVFENDNEGLSRKSAINLAINDLASKVQSRTRSESVIYNNKDVRDVVETQVNALVEGYKIESEGYDPGTIKYRVRVSIEGEQLVRQIERKLIK
jgi:hypothetical protein